MDVSINQINTTRKGCALVDHARPYASEESYFGHAVTEADLMTLVERALDLFLPLVLDRMSLEFYVVLVHEDITAQLAHRPVGVKHPNCDCMVQRGIVSSRCVSTFVYDMASQANRYHPGTDMVPAFKDRHLEVVRLRILKKSPYLEEEDEDRQTKERSRFSGKGSPPGRWTPSGRQLSQ